MRLDPQTFLISDTHFYHANIVRYCGRAEQILALSGRNIDHNKYMVDRWNAVVGHDDRVLHLGDLYFWRNDGPARFAKHIAPKLNGKRYLILGNHDKSPRSVYESLGFTVVDPFTTEIDGQRISFDHYPLPHNPNDALVHIHGHTHNNAPPKRNQINVSVEVMDYTPATLGSLLERRPA